MTSWLRSNGLNIAVVLAAVGAISGWVKAAEYRGQAETYREQARADSIRSDSIRSVRERKARSDSIRWQAATDSMAARAVRAEEARRREAEDRERAERARARALESAADLRQTLTPAQVPLFEAYEADRDMEADALRDQVASMGGRIDDLETENATLFRSRESIAELYDQAVEELAAKDGELGSLRGAYDALERANRSRGILPDFGRLTEPLYLVGGIAIGYVIAEAR